MNRSKIKTFTNPIIYVRHKDFIFQGLKGNLVRIFSNLNEEKFDEATPKYRRLLFCVSFFHCSLIARKRFRQLGYNAVYSFNDSDFDVTIILSFSYNFQKNIFYLEIKQVVYVNRYVYKHTLSLLFISLIIFCMYVNCFSKTCLLPHHVFPLKRKNNVKIDFKTGILF